MKKLTLIALVAGIITINGCGHVKHYSHLKIGSDRHVYVNKKKGHDDIWFVYMDSGSSSPYTVSDSVGKTISLPSGSWSQVSAKPTITQIEEEEVEVDTESPSTTTESPAEAASEGTSDDGADGSGGSDGGSGDGGGGD